MARDNKYQLKHRLEQLPVFEPDAVLWSRIEADLDFNQNLSAAIETLPTSAPNDELWNSIVNDIDSRRTPHINQFQPLKYIAIAASILFVVGLTTLWYYKQTQSQLKFETETFTDHLLLKNIDDPLKDQAILIIEAICENNQPACQQAVFKEKINLFHELEKEKHQLDAAVSQLGTSPEMIKAAIRIENLKSQTLQELIELVNS